MPRNKRILTLKKQDRLQYQLGMRNFADLTSFETELSELMVSYIIEVLQSSVFKVGSASVLRALFLVSKTFNLAISDNLRRFAPLNGDAFCIASDACRCCGKNSRPLELHRVDRAYLSEHKNTEIEEKKFYLCDLCDENRLHIFTRGMGVNLRSGFHPISFHTPPVNILYFDSRFTPEAKMITAPMYVSRILFSTETQPILAESLRVFDFSPLAEKLKSSFETNADDMMLKFHEMVKSQLLKQHIQFDLEIPKSYRQSVHDWSVHFSLKYGLNKYKDVDTAFKLHFMQLFNTDSDVEIQQRMKESAASIVRLAKVLEIHSSLWWVHYQYSRIGEYEVNFARKIKYTQFIKLVVKSTYEWVNRFKETSRICELRITFPDGRPFRLLAKEESVQRLHSVTTPIVLGSTRIIKSWCFNDLARIFDEVRQFKNESRVIDRAVTGSINRKRSGLINPRSNCHHKPPISYGEKPRWTLVSCSRCSMKKKG